MSTTLLPPLKSEAPHPATLSYDRELAEVLERFLAEKLATGRRDDIVSLRHYLSVIVAEAMPQLKRERHDRRAVDYLKGRLEWQLGLTARRPARGWREPAYGRGQLNAEQYQRLDAIGSRVIDFWSLLIATAAGHEINSAKELLYSFRSYLEIERSLKCIQNGLRPRTRLSALAT